MLISVLQLTSISAENMSTLQKHMSTLLTYFFHMIVCQGGYESFYSSRQSRV